ncbi:MAG: tetratricopeptide repeat protein [Caulobacteraceae bacterium]
MADLKAQAVAPYLQQSLLDMRAERHVEGAEWALKALEINERCGLAWHLLAICREKAGDYTNSLKCYEKALELEPDNAEISINLGRLAYQMDMKDVAEKLFAHYLVHFPGSPDGVNNLACAMRDQMKYDEAIEVLQTVIMANQDNALLWNTLATVLNERGDVAQAMIFFDEALRLDPAFAKARYNRGNNRLQMGDPRGGLIDCEEALSQVVLESEVVMMKLARSTMLIAAGDLGEGWDAYEIRLDPNYAETTHFLIDQPSWTPEADLAGKHILVMGEQGLGDEVLFANVLADVVDALGPEGHLTIAVEPRLVPLFQRSFPTATVGPHSTYRVDHYTVRVAAFIKDMTTIDLWAPMGSLLRRFRRSVDAYPKTRGFLKADPARVKYWRKTLKALGPGPNVGVVWKSMVVDSGRARYFSPFQQWQPILSTPGVRFVNLQYGDCAAELAEAKALGIEIWNPPGVDLKNDLDEVAALSAALDLVIGPANAATNIAAACGTLVWLISIPSAWPRLGQAHYPWYPQVRVFQPDTYNAWTPVMTEIGAALASQKF